MAGEAAQTLRAQRAEPRFDPLRELFAGRAGLPIASLHSQDRGPDELCLRIVGTHGERPIEGGQ